MIIQSHKKVIGSFCILGFVFNLKYLSQFFLKFKTQGQFKNPYDMQISKLSLIFILGRKLTEIFNRLEVNSGMYVNHTFSYRCDAKKLHFLMVIKVL